MMVFLLLSRLKGRCMGLVIILIMDINRKIIYLILRGYVRMILLLKLVLDLHIHLLSTKKVKFTPGDKEISYNSVTVIKMTLKLLKK